MPEIDLTEISTQRGGSQPLHGYLATPPGDGPWPGLVMLHEIMGLDPMMRRHADRMAEAGYLTLAVDLFSMGGARRCLVSTMRALHKQQGRPFTDIETARTWLRTSPQCTGKIGVIGFCMGGAFALLTATTDFDAAAVNYGPLPRDLTVLSGACPIVASYGARDRTLPKAAQKLQSALTTHQVLHDIKEYPTAGHAFLNDPQPTPLPLRPFLRVLGITPDPASAPHAWNRITTFFDHHLR
ncbi:dienelactone hydrolase family protein [Acrocarpospora catenulata]|uniref:dienelactone hydrolase family protein n=1 Tax=Acrocarpospora catenulata TaxID=2836182 RepID=UPI001BD9DEF9|nr:dienelactone hydrolase family protein [Acrocarpospora catenulata]